MYEMWTHGVNKSFHFGTPGHPVAGDLAGTAYGVETLPPHIPVVPVVFGGYCAIRGDIFSCHRRQSKDLSGCPDKAYAVATMIISFQAVHPANPAGYYNKPV